MCDDARYRCRVCGYRNPDQPWGADGRSPTYFFCLCCGVELGYEDSSPAGIRGYRERWVASGAPWYRPERRPPGWILSEQLRHVPAEYQ
jgi:hypothetical protein